MSDWKDRAIPYDSSWKDRSSSETPTPPASPEEIGQLEALGLGVGKGASLGFSDELVGAVKAIPELLTSGLSDATKKAYYEARDKQRLLEQSAQEQNPLTTLAGELAGGILLPVGPLGAGKGMMGALKAGTVLGGTTALGQAEDITNVGQTAKDVASGAAMGAIAGPAIEGTVGALKSAGKAVFGSFEKSGKVLQAFQAGKAGKNIIGKEALERETNVLNEGAQEVIDTLKDISKDKNKWYSIGKDYAKANNKTMDINDLKLGINDYFETNNTPVEIRDKILSFLDKHGDVGLTDVTDPKKIKILFDDLVTQETQSIKEKSYLKLKQEENKIAGKAISQAENDNKAIIKNQMMELKQQAEYVNITDEKQLKQLAIQKASEAGLLKNPQEEAANAAKAYLKTAEDSYNGVENIIEPVTGKEIFKANIGENKAVRSPIPANDELISGTMNSVENKAATSIDSQMDTIRNQTINLTNKENDRIVNQYLSLLKRDNKNITADDVKNLLMSKGQLKTPELVAEQAVEAARLSRGPIQTTTEFSPELNKYILSSKEGDRDLLSKIINPKFQEETLLNPKADIQKTENIRNQLSSMSTSATNKNDFIEAQALDKLKSLTNDQYYNMMPENVANNAKQATKNFSDILTAGFGKKGQQQGGEILQNPDLTAELRKTISDSVKSGKFDEKKSIDDMFNIIKSRYPDANAQELQNKVIDQAKLVGISEATTKKAMLQQKGVMGLLGATGEGAAVAGGNLAGLAVNKFVTSPNFTTKIPMMAADLAQRGMTKYSDMLAKIGASPLSKQRALVYTLLQEPEFRNAVQTYLPNGGE